MNGQSNIRKKGPWSTKAAMGQIYEMGLWGDNGSKFYSGDGSHCAQMVHPYLEAVTLFLKARTPPITVLDLGCGDFNVGSELVPFTKKYTAVDIVQELIDFNRRNFHYPNLEFQCLDIANDPLPPSDCVVLRQVLQHLSNGEVQKIVSRLANYKYVILTEHLPKGKFAPNKDIIAGQGIRLRKKSGLDLLAAPFYMKVKERQRLLCLNASEHKGVVVTDLFRMF